MHGHMNVKKEKYVWCDPN